MMVTIKNIFLVCDVIHYGRNLPNLQGNLLSLFPGIEERDISWDFRIKIYVTQCFETVPVGVLKQRIVTNECHKH
jgi:hypothetical protein